MFIQMLVIATTAMFIASCSSQTAIINGGGGGRGHTVRHESPKVKSASQVFGNQPMNPTPDAVASTWGATMSSEYWWNDARKGDRALLQRTSASEPVLVSRSTGFVWRAGCYNRVVPAEAFTEDVVENQSSGGNSIVQNGPSYAFEFNLPITIVGGGGGYCPPQPRPMYQPRPMVRYCAPRPVIRYCPPRPMVRYCQPPPRRHCR